MGQGRSTVKVKLSYKSSLEQGLVSFPLQRSSFRESLQLYGASETQSDAMAVMGSLGDNPGDQAGPGVVLSARCGHGEIIAKWK